MGESNGTVSMKPDGRMEIALNRPTDPLDLPEADKTKAYLHFVSTSDVADQKVLTLLKFLVTTGFNYMRNILPDLMC